MLRVFLGLVLLSVTTLRVAGWMTVPPSVLTETARLGYYPLTWDPDEPLPMIWGTVNRTPAQFLVDTGFTYLTIDRRVAREVESMPADAARLMGPLLGPSAGTNWFVIRRLTLSRAEFTGMPARILDLRLGREEEVRCQGVLGADFLRGQHAIIFCGDNRLLIKTHAIDPSAQETIDRLLRQAGYREVVMESQPLLVWMVPVRIGETDFKMVVDTGAARTLLDADFAKQLSVRGRGFSHKLTGVESRVTKARRATVKDFQIGSYLAPDSKIMLGNAGLWNPAKNGKLKPGLDAGLSAMQGMLGFDFLQKHSAVIDCQGGKLWLRPPGK